MQVPWVQVHRPGVQVPEAWAERIAEALAAEQAAWAVLAQVGLVQAERLETHPVAPVEKHRHKRILL